jgi:hypothetical protein
MALILFLIVLYIEIKYAGLISFYYGGHFYAEFFNAIYFEYLEFLIIIGIALVFSSFTTPVMSALFTFFVFAIGRFSSDIRLFAEEIKNPVTAVFSEVIYRVIPNLEKFDVRNEAVYGGTVNPDLLLYTTAYALLYTAALLILAIIIFEKKEFK